MFELFIALFGGIYYAVKIRTEKENHRTFQEESKALAETAQLWRKQVTDKELERRLYSDMLNRDKREELVRRLLQYKEMYPDFCKNIRYAQNDRGWDNITEDIWLLEKNKKNKFVPKRWCLELLMMTYGKCTSSMEFDINTYVIYHTKETLNKWDAALLNNPWYLTYDAMQYLYTNPIPVLQEDGAD